MVSGRGMRFPNRSLGTRDGTGLRCRIVIVMFPSSRTRQVYLRVLFLVVVGSAAVAVLLNIPVAQAYFATGAPGRLASCFFFCVPFTVRGRVSPSWVRASFVVVAFALLFWTLLGQIGRASCRERV